MRSDELMKFDWVQAVCEHYEPYEIVLEQGQVELVNRGLVYPDSGGIFYDETQCGNRKYEILEPVPLTEPMLKANGFEFGQQSDDLHYRSYRLDSLVVMWHTGTDGFGTIIGMSGHSYKYVHELQHIMRLCGLRTQANNFKIEGV